MNPAAVFYLGQLRTGWCDKRPMSLVFCTAGNPELKQVFFFWGESLVSFGRRHDIVRVRGGDTTDQFAFLRTTRDDGEFVFFSRRGRFFEFIEAQTRLA